jgi:hypothetical protein
VKSFNTITISLFVFSVVTEAKTFKQRTRTYCRIKMAIFGEASRASIAGFILTVNYTFQYYV